MKRHDVNNNFFERYRDLFPITKETVYLDHAGIAPISLRVQKAVEQFLREAAEYGSFRYRDWIERVEETRRKGAKLINADAGEIAFIKNTSHGLSVVAEGIDWQQGDNLIVYEKEFPSNLFPWLNLERKGVEVKFIPSREGRILIDDIEDLIDSNTRLLSISSAQFMNGFRIDLRNLGELCRSKSVLLCVDAIQSLGIIPMDVKRCYIDFLTADGHKWLLSPEGTGMFYCRKELAESINPPLIGWKSVQNDLDFDHPVFRLKTDARRFEEGSLNIMGIIALGASLDMITEVGIERIEKRILELGDRTIQEAEKRGFDVKSPVAREERSGIVSLSGNFEPKDVQDRLRSQRIMVNVRGKAIRLSPHFYNTEHEIHTFFAALDDYLAL